MNSMSTLESAIRYVKEKSQIMGFYRLEICDRARYLIKD